MSVSIRLMKIGKKNYPTYRIIAIDKRKKRNGRYIEKIGIYNPHTTPHTLKLDQKKLNYWLTRGAQLSEGLQKLLSKKG